MRRTEFGRSPRLRLLASPAYLLVLIAATACPTAAQQAPKVPSPTLPSASPREVELEARLRKMEEANQQLADQMQLLMKEVKSLRTEGSKKPEVTAPASGAGATAAGGSGRSVGSAGGSSAQNEPGRNPAAPNYQGVSGAKSSKNTPLQADFGPGFQLQSSDGEYQVQFHQETQLDYRAFDPTGEEFARQGFVIPRVRAFANGRVTKGLDYMVSVNRGFGNLDILDAWVNFHPSDKFQVKLGRFMTPMNYEQFAIQNMWLIAPERSLFTSNLGLNRQLGVMVWGQAFNERVDYAVGVFDGPRNSFVDYNDAKDVMTYLNVRPFQNDDDSFLRDLNLGGSFAYGDQGDQDATSDPLIPRSFRVAANASNAGTANRYAPPFLTFNDSVIERGSRMFWSANVAYFYKQLSIFADYNGGIVGYADSKNAASSVESPVSGFSVAAGYFLTGETVQRRTIVEPKRPFSLKHGAFAPGAVELVARYNTFNIDENVFTGKLADPTKWSNSAWGTNVGINWYLNRYVKIYLDWQHSEFGSPVFYASPNKRSIANEMYWLRFQFYF